MNPPTFNRCAGSKNIKQTPAPEIVSDKRFLHHNAIGMMGRNGVTRFKRQNPEPAFFNWREHVGIEPTQVGLTTYTGFEDQRAHQLPIYSQGGLHDNIPFIFSQVRAASRVIII